MLDRTIAPPFHSDFTFDLINPVSVVLPNNIPVHFVTGGEQEVIKIELIMPAGRWFEKTWGSSYFTANLLAKGTRNKSSYEIAGLMDHMGVHFEVHSGLDIVSLVIYSLTKKLVPALDLLLEILSEPTFPEKEVEQSKAIYIQNLKVNQEKTSYLASKFLRRNIFGSDHPYGKELEEADVVSITREQLATFHQNHFFDAIAIISGNLKDSHVKAISDRLATVKKKPVSPVQQQTPAGKPFSEHTPKADSVQTSIRLGKQSILRKDSAYPYVLFLNHLLGGYFGSRLMKNLREDKGLTYGISSSLQILRHHSYLVIGTDVNKENKDLAITEIRKELEILCNERVASEEIETAKNHFIGSIQAELSTSFAHADKIRTILLNDLSMDFYNNLVSTIKDIKPEQLLDIAGKYLNPESFFETSVG